MPQINIAICSSCGGNLGSPEKAKNYIYKGFGFPVQLNNAVAVSTCEKCAESEFTIPNIPGLMAAVALQRVMLPYKLTGPDIRFVRKAIGENVSSALLAKHLEVTPETFSRYENDKMVMSPTTEKLLRIIVGLMLEDKAPAMDFDVQKVADMRVQSAWNQNGSMDKQVPMEDMVFELVRVRMQDKRVEEGYLLQAA
jgi:DNA-binding transcriptional regulator YiaG